MSFVPKVDKNEPVSCCIPKLVKIPSFKAKTRTIRRIHSSISHKVRMRPVLSLIKAKVMNKRTP